MNRLAGTVMLTRGLVLAAVCLSACSAVAHSESEVPSARPLQAPLWLPLISMTEGQVNRSSFPELDFPVVRVGGLASEKVLRDNYRRPLLGGQTTGSANPAAAAATTRAALLPPQSNFLTYLSVVGPLEAGHEEWDPVSLSLSGNQLELTINEWKSNEGVEQPSLPFRPVYLIPIGRLAAGQFDLTVSVHRLYNDVSKDSYYRPVSIRAGSLSFDVGGPDAGPGAAIPTLMSSAFKLLQTPLPNQQFERTPITIIRRVAGRPSGPVEPGLRVGQVDADAWKSLLIGGYQPDTATPVLSTPTSKDRLAAIITGPTLSTEDWMELSSVEWQSATCLLHVMLWRDRGARWKNVLTQTTLVVPLHLPKVRRAGTGSGDYRIVVDWTELSAPGPGGPYSQKNASSSEPDASINSAVELSVP